MWLMESSKSSKFSSFNDLFSVFRFLALLAFRVLVWDVTRLKPMLNKM